MGKKNVAGLLVETLARAGVRNIYGVSGDSLNAITDRLRTSSDLRWVHVRHEETAAFAAGAEAHLTNRLAVCAGSCGPGNLHLINGLYDCHRSRVPVLAIAAQIPSNEIGSGYFQETHPEHLKKALEHYQDARKGLDELATEGDKVIHPQYVSRVVSELAAEDAIFSCDVGTPTIWAARYLRMNGKRRLLGSFNHGSMANALPQAIGAQVSHPGRQVIALSGDGGLAMLMGDLLTLRQMELPVKVIVFKNDALAFVELEMKAAGILDFGTDLVNPDFAKVADAAGLLGLTAEKPEDVRPAFAEALRHDGAALVQVSVSRQELSMPPTITLEQMKGFSLFMLKAVLSSRGSEIIDLAKINLWR